MAWRLFRERFIRPFFLGSLLLFVITATGCAEIWPTPVNEGPYWKETPELNEAFADSPDAAFVLLDDDRGSLFAYNMERVDREFPPASTFEIPLALLAFQTGAVQDLDEFLPYSGGTRHHEAVERHIMPREKTSNGATFCYTAGVAGRLGCRLDQKRRQSLPDA